MKSKAGEQIRRELEAVFKRYGVDEHHVLYVPSDGRVITSLFRGTRQFRMQTALSSLNAATKLSVGG